MYHCPLTYEQSPTRYSSLGLKPLGVKDLAVFPYTIQQQLLEAASRSDKMSIQGVQPKLSVVLNRKQSRFDLVDRGGKYIIKPQHPVYAQLPENEDLTMHLASLCGINVPWHGLLYAVDGSLSYVIKRFDRQGWSRVPVEDFAQLSGKERATKYDSSMEQVAQIIDKFCTFPLLEKTVLFRLVLFSFLIGNEDLHLKNFSVIVRDGKVMLSPAYDLLNTTIVLQEAREEAALPVNGKKNGLGKKELLKYFPREYLGLSDRQTDLVVKEICSGLALAGAFIAKSFLSEENKQKYLELLTQRISRLGLKQN